MALSPGTRLGPYEVVSAAGAGGMGEVYRARDSRLNRDVAVKVLPPAFAKDAERLRRFQQEAQAAAALNHPNILAVYDFGEDNGSPYIVMEFLEGVTLRELLRPGPIGSRKAAEFAEQIANGLDAAHRKGIVHRDLKPENLFVTRDAVVKILDFGLAKRMPVENWASADAATMDSGTEPGVVLGTVGYMSPEQVRGWVADHRSDLFSLGTVLYEMLSGKRAFQRQTAVETMTAIMKEDPPALAVSAANISPLMQQVVNHCLEKSEHHRFQTASDLSFALRAIQDSSSSMVAAVAPPERPQWVRWAVAAVGVLLLAAVLIFLVRRGTTEAPGSSVMAAILPPPGDGFWANITQPVAISPDGRFLALIAMRNQHRQLWLRRLDVAEAQPIAGSEDASNPFWSPDSRFIAFFVPGKLKRVDIAGGAVSDICPAGSFGMGGSWSSRGVILLATFGSAVKRVAENGGTPEAIPGAELAGESVGHMWPSFLPDGKHFLYLDWKFPFRGRHEENVWIGSLDGEKARRLPLSATNAHYSSGYLLFSHEGDLVAQKFDLTHFELSGAVQPIARNIQYDTFFQDGMFSVSRNGVLIYGGAGVGVNTVLTWLDRSGKTLSVLGQPAVMYRHAISPDGKRVAVSVKFPEAREKIWIYDAETGTRVALMAEETGPSLYSPVWSRDGRQIAYRGTAGKSAALLVHAADGSGEEKNPGGIRYDLLSPRAWSPDGRYLAMETTKFEGRVNWEDTLRVVRADGSGEPVLNIADADAGQFSPDGHWLAYGDETSGEVYVTAFPGPGARIAVSSHGGGEPHWRADGNEIFYVDDDRNLIAARVQESEHEFRVLSTQTLFRLQLPGNVQDYDVAPDGQRFLVNMRTSKEQNEPLTLVTDWTAQLRSEGK